jgi:hypothetical protein
MNLRHLTVAATAALAAGLGGCGDHNTGASSAESHAPGTTLAAKPGPCEAYPAGAPGVVRTYCDGPATVTIHAAGADHLLKGGSCSTANGEFALNLGVVSNAELGGPKPDYVGITAPVASGPFSNAMIAVTLDGTTYALTENTGEITAKGGSFNGVPIGGGEPVTGTFSCS